MLRLFISVSMTLLLTSCGGSGSSSSEDDTQKKKQQAEEQVLDYMKGALSENAYSYPQYGIFDIPGVVTAEVDSSAARASSTNLQEQGVDELDSLKVSTENSVLYSLYKNGIQVTGFDADGSLTEKKQNLDIEANLKGLYLADNKLVAIDDASLSIWDHWFEPTYFGSQKTDVRVLQITNDGTLNPDYEYLSFEGALISSRKVDQRLYLVLRHFPSVTYKQEGVIDTEELTIEDVLPSYSKNNLDQGLSVEAINCVINEETAHQQANVLNIVSIDLSSDNLDFDSQCYVGDAEALYASTQAIYLASTSHNYGYENGRPVYDSGISTDIHKFSFADNGVTYQGSGQVKGHLGWDSNRKSFRMSENQGDLRVISFDEDRPWLDFAIAETTAETGNPLETSPVRLTVLRPNTDATALEEVATLPNEQRPAPIGKENEQLYASQFIGDKAYLVTFRVIDPLYVLNIENPTDPFIEGELEIDGYSDYLFPVGNDLLIGIGKDAVADENSGEWGGAWYQGVKLSLVDVSDPTNPTEVDRVTIGKRGTSSQALYSHHAYNQMALDGLTRFTLPIEVHNEVQQYHSGSPSDWFGYSFTGLFKYEVDLQQKTLNQVGLVEVPEKDSQNYYHYLPQRSRMIEDQVHFLYEENFYSQDWQAEQDVSVLNRN